MSQAPSDKTFDYDVFISYSSYDSKWVHELLLPYLEDRAGLRACIDFRDFEIGVASLINMERAVECSRKILLILTPNWIKSEWTIFESLLAQTDDPSGLRQRILPIKLAECDPPKRISMLTYADLTKEGTTSEMQLMRISNAIKKDAKRKILNQTSMPSVYLIPTLPLPYFAHFFDLHANFTGREKERQMLSDWLKSDRKPVLTLVAIGGMGKSSLAWHWVKNDLDTSLFEGIIWWSFYSGESSFSKFLDEAIIYVSNSANNPYEIQFDYDKVKVLIGLFSGRKFLFIFDGFEKQLGIYDSQKECEESNESDESDTRACIDPKAAYFLRSIAAGTTLTKLLITTRAMIKDLEDNVGNSLDGCSKVLLNSMDQYDAIRFMRAQGVIKGSDNEINIACKAYGYHPLSLRYLSGLIARDKKNPGDILVAPHYDEHLDIKSARDHILEATYNALPERYQILLSKIAALRGASLVIG